jgi:hypothetical protein
MTRLQKIIIAAMAVAAGIYETSQTARLRSRIRSVEEQQAQLSDRLSQLQGERDDIVAKLAVAQAELDRERTNAVELLRLRAKLGPLQADFQELSRLKAAGTNQPTETGMRDWIMHAIELQNLVAQLPGPRTPEFKYLTTMDWLDVAKDADISEDQLPTLLVILEADARANFGHFLQNALNQYLAAHNGELPTTVAELKSYFTVPVDDGIFQYYEMLHTGNVADLAKGDDWTPLITEKTSGLPKVNGNLIQNLIQIATNEVRPVGQPLPPK